MKIVSWNVNGIRAIIKKDFVKDVKEMDPDIICFQETKGTEEDTISALEALPDYKVYANSSKARKGYSGTAIALKKEPDQITYDLGLTEFDQEGRITTAEFPHFFLTTVYTPNSGEELARLDYREKWDREFLNYVTWLKKRKPVIVCGDLNVAHEEIDIARPKENYNKSAGYTQREIDGLERLLKEGFTDTYRHLHPKEVQYTYWNYVTNARAKNVGWRIDYFLVSNWLKPKVKEARIYDQYLGSDHCPVSITLNL